MAIINSFEVTVLTPCRGSASSENASTKRGWAAVEEHKKTHVKPHLRDRADFRQRYIAALPPTDQVLGEFAIDFKAHCGFTFADNDGTEFLVFRTYLDGEKIGTGYVKQQRWERSGTYRVRKKSRRFWLTEHSRWVEQKWHFDHGLHGTLKVEVWRQRRRTPSHGSWDHPANLPVAHNEFGEYIDLAHPSVELNPKLPHVRHTEKIDQHPLATFVFEYRSEDTLRAIGVLQGPVREPATVDLTYEADTSDDLVPQQEIFNFSSSSMFTSSPSTAISDTSVGFWPRLDGYLGQQDTLNLAPQDTSNEVADSIERPIFPSQLERLLNPFYIMTKDTAQLGDAMTSNERIDLEKQDTQSDADIVDLTMLD